MNYLSGFAAVFAYIQRICETNHIVLLFTASATKRLLSRKVKPDAVEGGEKAYTRERIFGLVQSWYEGTRLVMP